ncbi:MAG: CRISPR-associated helicase Cas3', partial [Desulfurococcaceae archaeon]
MLHETYDKVLAYIKKKRGIIHNRPLLIKALEGLESASKENFLINAPTGYGKSLISMGVALHEFYQDSKTIIAYPLRTLIEQQSLDMKEMFHFHGIGRDLVGTRYMGSKESLYLVHPITLTTIDTLSLTAMGLSPEDIGKVYSSIRNSWLGNLGHYLFSWSSIFASTYLILDEVHLMYDSSKSLSFLKFLMNLCELTGVRMILMTATFPKKFENVLPLKKVEKIGFNKDDDPGFYDERNSKKYGIELLYLKKSDKLSKIREVLRSNDFKKALVIFNTVEDAADFYRLIDGNKILIHSRFTNEDKKTKVSELEKIRSPDEKYVVISTQAIEAGVDISADLIITEVSPPISLVQRFGRFLRYDERSGKAFVWVEEEVLNYEDSNLYKVYDKRLVKKTLDYLS